jgi:hypothetical protein
MMGASMEYDTKPLIHVCDNMHMISEIMDSMRKTHSSARRTTNEYLMFCLIGFGSIEKRDTLLTAVNWALQPILTYSSFVKEVSSQEFEAIVVTKKQVDMNVVEEWLGLFNMGVCCVEFEEYMQPAMVTCISRIHHMGKHWHGSFKTKLSARVRRDFYKEYMKQQLAKEHQRVLEVTGMTVTPRNMLALHGRMTSLQTYVSYLERETQAMRAMRDTPLVIPGAATTDAEMRDSTPPPPPPVFASAEHLRLLTRVRQAPLPQLDTHVVVARAGEAYLEGISTESTPHPHSPRTSPPSSPMQAYRRSSVTPPYVRVVGVPFVLRPAPTPGMTVYVVRS